MAELVPAPFASLVQRICRELDREEAIFHLPRRKWWTPDADGPDLSVTFHNQPAGNPLGPAAGPQTQMAQNLVLSWLAGARIMELKTVQINDRLRIARPCIDATNIGYNIEWSQELRIAEALREYVAGSMLIHMLAHGGLLGDSPLTQTATDTIYDISLGYDLAGIRSAPIRTFVEQMRDAKSLVEHLRGEIPREFKPLRDLDYPTRISTSVTLSTFHGCPADEIERICEFLIAEMDCDVIIKMNPPMLGKERLEHLLHDVLGYDEIRVPDHAYASGLQFDESLEVCDRLTRLAVNRGRRLGAKFSNTLEVENHRDFFDSEIKTQYLSGQPLHVITLTLADAFRQAVGPSTPLTFSAGVDRFNVANMVACGFCPITTCTDLLRPGGYGRLPLYLKALTAEMNRAGASNIDAFILKGSIGVSPVEGNESPTTGS
ncbi:MAG: glutamate synthase, partial [Phycisphaerae bacterium]